jgi:hypothetical protein
MNKNNTRTCFWCSRPIYADSDVPYLLGKVDGKDLQINMHEACTIRACLKLMGKLEYTTRRDGTNFILKRKE